jgi:hypothetical protein
MTESKSVALPLGYSPMKLLHGLTSTILLHDYAPQDFLYVVLYSPLELAPQDKDNPTLDYILNQNREYLHKRSYTFLYAVLYSPLALTPKDKDNPTT